MSTNAKIEREAADAVAPRIRPIAIANWLYCVAFLVFLIVIVGGITRLTESGLSITQWKPISGALPPLSESQWIAEFELYQNTTEYQTVNKGMSLADFKLIYFWEFFHRLIGRIIGLAFFIPFVWFAIKRAIPSGYGWRLFALLALGGLQGVIGWWMVRSGLSDRVDVSHYRLAVHLLNAFFIIGGLVWTALDLRQLAAAKEAEAMPARMTKFAAFALVTLFIQLLLGAYTAGLNAGYAFSSWPKMGDEWFPSAVTWAEPFWTNLSDNPIVVQFEHRWFAFVAVAVLVWLAVKASAQGAVRAAWALAILLIAQIIFGILTLLTGVEIWVAVAHQAIAALIVIAATCCAHRLGSAA